MYMIINDNSSKTYLHLIHNTYSFLYMFIFMRQVKYENTNHNLQKLHCYIDLHLDSQFNLTLLIYLA